MRVAIDPQTIQETKKFLGYDGIRWHRVKLNDREQERFEMLKESIDELAKIEDEKEYKEKLKEKELTEKEFLEALEYTVDFIRGCETLDSVESDYDIWSDGILHLYYEEEREFAWLRDIGVYELMVAMSMEKGNFGLTFYIQDPLMTIYATQKRTKEDGTYLEKWKMEQHFSCRQNQ